MTITPDETPRLANGAERKVYPALLEQLQPNGAYWHPERQATYVGDLIDRGDQQLRVLEIVTGMVDSGSAQIVMGNHEFNGIAFATQRPDGRGDGPSLARGLTTARLHWRRSGRRSSPPSRRG